VSFYNQYRLYSTKWESVTERLWVCPLLKCLVTVMWGWERLCVSDSGFLIVSS
jgi:hypothetical protein